LSAVRSARGPEPRRRAAATVLRPPSAVRPSGERPRARTAEQASSSAPPASARRPLGLGPSLSADSAPPLLTAQALRPPSAVRSGLEPRTEPLRDSGAPSAVRPTAREGEQEQLRTSARRPLGRSTRRCPCPSVRRAAVPSGFAVHRTAHLRRLLQPPVPRATCLLPRQRRRIRPG
jgi:hypothetical protein